MVAIRPTRAPALGDQLAAMLRDDIIRRVLEPGKHLVEDALAAAYDVSRGPVRDALRQLESQGLIESRRRGFYVVGMDESDIDDLYELRESIEVVAARRAVEKANPQWLQAARSVVADMVKAADRSDASEFATADMRFHGLLYEVSGNRRLLDVWEDYAPVFASIMQLTVEEDQDLHPSATDHDELLDIIERGDVESLTERLREHLHGARARMARAIQDLIAQLPEDRAS